MAHHANCNSVQSEPLSPEYIKQVRSNPGEVRTTNRSPSYSSTSAVQCNVSARLYIYLQLVVGVAVVVVARQYRWVPLNPNKTMPTKILHKHHTQTHTHTIHTHKQTQTHTNTHTHHTHNTHVMQSKVASARESSRQVAGFVGSMAFPLFGSSRLLDLRSRIVNLKSTAIWSHKR